MNQLNALKKLAEKVAVREKAITERDVRIAAVEAQLDEVSKRNLRQTREIMGIPEQLASARNDALEEAGLYHDTEVKKLQNAIFTLILGQREQPLRDAIEHHEISAAGIRALKTKGGDV